jgi:hypothetical protein
MAAQLVASRVVLSPTELVSLFQLVLIVIKFWVAQDLNKRIARCFIKYRGIIGGSWNVLWFCAIVGFGDLEILSQVRTGQADHRG